MILIFLPHILLSTEENPTSPRFLFFVTVSVIFLSTHFNSPRHLLTAHHRHHTTLCSCIHFLSWTSMNSCLAFFSLSPLYTIFLSSLVSFLTMQALSLYYGPIPSPLFLYTSNPWLLGLEHILTTCDPDYILVEGLLARYLYYFLPCLPISDTWYRSFFMSLPI